MKPASQIRGLVLAVLADTDTPIALPPHILRQLVTSTGWTEDKVALTWATMMRQEETRHKEWQGRHSNR